MIAAATPPDAGLWVMLVSLVAFPVVVVVRMPAMLVAMHRKQQNERLIALDTADPRYSQLYVQCDAFKAWLDRSGFVWIGFYWTPMGALIGAWRQPGHDVFFCLYLVRNKPYYDFVTLFDGHLGLTTGTSAGGQLFPKCPGSYTQTFTPRDVDSQWLLHATATRYLTTTGGARLNANPSAFEPDFNRSMQVQLAYVATIRLWPVRGIYWYFVRRHLRHNKSIEEQHRRGWVRLPNELTDCDRQRRAVLMTAAGQANS